MSEAKPPETTVAAIGGGLSIRFGDRVASLRLGMEPAEFAAAKAACDALLREMVEAVTRDEATKITTQGDGHG